MSIFDNPKSIKNNSVFEGDQAYVRQIPQPVGSDAGDSGNGPNYSFEDHQHQVDASTLISSSGNINLTGNASINGKLIYFPVDFQDGLLTGTVPVGTTNTLIQFGPNFGQGNASNKLVVNGTFRIDVTSSGTGTVLIQPLFYDPNGTTFLDTRQLFCYGGPVTAGQQSAFSATWDYTLIGTGSPCRVEFYALKTGTASFSSVGSLGSPNGFSTGVRYAQV